jgi:transposase
MDERLRFVARLLEGDKMAVLCREFGISRKTGYKLYRRYRDIGLEVVRSPVAMRCNGAVSLTVSVALAIWRTGLLPKT